jgi:hypothetical protein
MIQRARIALAVLIPCLSLFSSAQAITTLHILNQPITPGQLATVEIRLEDPVNILGVNVGFLYDPRWIQPITNLEGKEFEDGVPGVFASINYDTGSPITIQGKKGIALALYAPNLINQSVRVARLQFRVADTLPPNATTDLTFHPLFLNSIKDSENNSLPLLLQTDDSAPVPPKNADLNGDETVNLNDSRIALKALLGLATLSPEQIAGLDFNSDGRFDLIDLRLLLRWGL